MKSDQAVSSEVPSIKQILSVYDFRYFTIGDSNAECDNPGKIEAVAHFNQWIPFFHYPMQGKYKQHLLGPR